METPSGEAGEAGEVTRVEALSAIDALERLLRRHELPARELSHALGVQLGRLALAPGPRGPVGECLARMYSWAWALRSAPDLRCYGGRAAVHASLLQECRGLRSLVSAAAAATARARTAPA
jgi:hypothetical protein